MNYKTKAKKLVAQMTLEEKASLMSGKDFWYLKGIERLELPEVMVTDGPHGLRKQAGESDHLGINASVPAVCFPTASATACSFSRDLMNKIGIALGEECRQEQVAVILGPGVNIKRSPLCGRNFEYISEDPYLTGQMAASLVKGVQSQNVGVSVKHYAVNNQETRRMTIDSVVDERALREIYLAGYEAIVKEADPWTFMCCYNLVNGTYGAENKYLLTDILREEWGFEGLVMTDWGAINDRVKGVQAGLDLQMPADGGSFDKLVVQAVQDGQLDEADLDKAVVNVVDIILRSLDRKPMEYDVVAHRELARRAAVESSVLLKNDNHILPVQAGETFAVIGAFAKTPRYQGSGSSKIEPIKLDNLYNTLTEAGVEFAYADGYDLATRGVNEALIAQACETAKGQDKVFIIAGLPDEYEAEGYDRADMGMPEAHNRLIEAVAAVNPNVCVVLLCGSPVEMPWHDDAAGILVTYLGGEAGGAALADMLMGSRAPGGRLAETWPLSVTDNPSYAYFPGYSKSVEYRESIYVGYRYYDTAKKEVRYPFGYGLSYTEFSYGKPELGSKSIKDTDELTVSITIKNTGKKVGSEVVQLYVSHKKPTIYKAEQELKDFRKIILEPGKSAEVTFTLDKRAFAFYNVETKDWQVESGEYEIRIGASSRDIRHTATVHVDSTSEAQVPDYRASASCYYDLSSGIANVPDAAFREVLGHEPPPREREPGTPHTPNSTFSDITDTKFGRRMYKMAKKQVGKVMGDSGEDIQRMAEAMIDDMPLRMLYMLGGGKMTPRRMDGLLTMINGQFFKGLGMMLKKAK